MLRRQWLGRVYKASWSWVILSLVFECGSIYVGVSCRNIVFITTHWTPSLWLCAFVLCFTTHWKHTAASHAPKVFSVSLSFYLWYWFFFLKLSWKNHNITSILILVTEKRLCTKIEGHSFWIIKAILQTSHQTQNGFACTKFLAASQVLRNWSRICISPVRFWRVFQCN